MDYGFVLRNAYTSWLSDKKSLFYVLILFFIGLFFTGLMFFLVWLFFQDILIQILKLSTESARTVDTGTSRLIAASFMQKIIPFLLVFIPLLVIQFIVTFFIRMLMVSRALMVSGFKTVPITGGKFVKIILLEIWMNIASIISWYNRIFFFYFIGLIILSFFVGVLFVLKQAIPAVILLLLVLLLFLIYYIIICYNSIRLSLANAIFLQKNQGISETTRDAWALGKSKVLEILLGFLAVFVPIITVNMFIGFATGIFGIVGTVLQQIVQVILIPVITIIGAFGYVAIYSEALKPKK